MELVGAHLIPQGELDLQSSGKHSILRDGLELWDLSRAALKRMIKFNSFLSGRAYSAPA